MGSQYFFKAFEKFLELINEERLIFYAISPRGLRHYFSTSRGEPWPRGLFAVERDQWESERFTLDEITHKTGGLHLKGKMKYENFIKELGRDLTHFYDISYTPPKETRKKGFHRIEVRVKRPGLIVRHRKGYSDFTDEDVERRAVASAFISPSFSRDIDFSCKTDFLFIRGSRPQFWIRMQIPLDQFRNIEGISPPEKLGVMFGINRWEENRVHFGETEFSIKDKVERGMNYLYSAFITSSVKLKTGEYEIRVLLRESGNRISGWEAQVKIPDLKKTSNPAIINSIFGFLKKEEKENPAPFSVSTGDGLLLLSNYKFYPYVNNTFREGRKVGIFFQIFNPSKVQDFPFQFVLHQDENMIFPVPSQQIEKYFDKKLKFLNAVYLLNFDEIPPGDYQLKITSLDGQLEKEIKNVILERE